MELCGDGKRAYGSIGLISSCVCVWCVRTYDGIVWRWKYVWQYRTNLVLRMTCTSTNKTGIGGGIVKGGWGGRWSFFLRREVGWRADRGS